VFLAHIELVPFLFVGQNFVRGGDFGKLGLGPDPVFVAFLLVRVVSERQLSVRFLHVRRRRVLRDA